MLGTLLILIAAGSLALLTAALKLSGAAPTQTTAIRQWLTVYSLIVTAVLIIGILWFLGFRRGGSPAFRESQRATLDWLGYYDAAGVPLRFSADGGNTSLKLPRLGPDDSIDLTPMPHPPRNESIDWQMTAIVNSQPLRVNEVCVNVPGNNWLLTRDLIVIEETDRSSFFTLEFLDERRFLRPVYAFRYNQGSIAANGARQYDLRRPVEIWSTPIASARTLAAMFRTLDRYRKPPKEVPAWQFWRWARPSFDQLLRPGVGRDAFFARLEHLDEFAKDVIAVREETGQSSRTGILIAGHAGWTHVFRINRTSSDGSTYSILGGAPRVEMALPEHTEIELGSGGPAAKQRLILPTKWSRDRITGNVADIFVHNQQRWELPPNARDPFVIMSSEADVPISGYDLDIGMRRQPFYAKAVMNADGTFVINDGRNEHGAATANAKPAVKAGEMFRLGAGHTGALLAFRLAASPVPFAGVWALAIVAALCTLFVLTISRSRVVDPLAETAWAILLHLVMSIFLVRVVLNYRLALLPPADASAPIRALFDHSLLWSLIAVAAIPFAMLLLHWLSRGRTAQAIRDVLASHRIVGNIDVPVGVAVAVILLAVWSFIVIVSGAKENVGPIRVNVATQVISLLALAFSAEWMAGLPSWRRAAAVAVWFAVPVVLMVFIVGDHGFLINAMAMLLVAASILLWDRYRRFRWYEWAIIAVVAVVLTGAIVLRERILIGIASDSLIERVASPKESYVYYRIAASSAGRERLLEKVGDPDDFRFDMYRRNAAHHWQMLLYASEGISMPKGYGGARLSRVGMSYPTSLSDSMFAIHLLPEHGMFGGIGLLLIYLTAATVAVVIGGTLPEVFRARAFTLLGIGAHLIFTTLYMASTNLGQFVFTGQNVPLLSLASGSDILAGALLLAIVTTLAHTSVQARAPQLFGRSQWLRRIGVFALAAAAVWVIVLGVVMYQVGSDAGRRKSLRFPAGAMRTYREHLPGASPNPSIVYERRRLVIHGPVSWIEQKFVDQFNESPDRYDRNAGFYYLTRTAMGEPSVRINERYFSIASPFHPPRRWNGIIRYGAQSYPTLNVLGSDLQIHPGRTPQPESISLAAPPDAKHDYSSRLLLKLSAAGPSLCEITLDGGKANVYPMQTRTPQVADWQVRVDGEEPRFGRELRGGEIIRIDGRIAPRRGPPRPFSYSLLYLGNYEPVLAATRWRNGEMHRIVHAGTLESVISDIGAALDTEISEADDAEATAARLPKAINLTVEMLLQNDLDERLATAGPPIYGAEQGQRRNALAVSVVDAFSGDVLALSSWQPPQNAPERNWNIRNHAIGSTIKPILLSTIAVGYEGSGFDVTEFAAVDQSDCAGPPGPPPSIHPHCSVAGIALETPWDCLAGTRPVLDTRTFLIESRNFMAVTLGMLGMVTDPRDWQHFLAPFDPHAATPAQYRGTRYTLSLPRAPSMAFTVRDPIPSPLPSESSRSVLFTTMPRLFHVVVPRAMTAEELDQQSRDDLALYLPSLSGLTVGKNYYIDDILPDRIELLPHDLQSTRRELLPFFLGGGREGFWSSVRMSETAARLATGLKVDVHLDRLPMPRVSPQMPAPLANTAWRERNIMEPLTLVGRDHAALPGVGTLNATAAGLGDYVDATAHGRTYRALFKTGTLDERDSGRFESEMLLFVVGEWSNGAFVRGRTVSGYMYMADTKIKSERQWQRGDVARQILQALVDYLERRPAEAAPAQTAEAIKQK